MPSTTDERHIALSGRAALVENSGIAMSSGQPGVIFAINDSGNEPVLFALDTTGADRGAWRIRGAKNIDWEAISTGPCGTRRGTTADGAARCLYIGDVGDNDGRRVSLTLYRLEEPRALAGGPTADNGLPRLDADALTVTLEDGPRDVEAMYVSLDGTAYLITKRAERIQGGGLRRAQVYSVPATAWAQRSTVARRVDSLPIVPGSAPLRTITDAARSEDGRYLAVRTYTEVYLFPIDPQTGRLLSKESTPCDVSKLNEPQGEGITWRGASSTLLLSSEGRREPLRLVECPRPSPGKQE